MPKNVDHVYYSGHSLGGAMMPAFVTDHALNIASGMILLGSFLTRIYRTGNASDGRPQVVYPIPTLTIGGELDGLCRVTRIIEALYSQVIVAEDINNAKKNLGVTIIKGINHMQFASGNPPKFVSDHDIQPEVSEDEAHKRIVDDMSQYLMNLYHQSNWESIATRIEQSIEFSQPIIDAFLLEGNFNYLAPCFCESIDEYGYMQFGTCQSTPACNGGSQWTSLFAQPIMGSLKESSLKVVNVDSIHIVTEENPSCHLPHIHSSQLRSNSIPWGNPGSIQPDEKTNSWNPYIPPLCDSPDNCTLYLTSVTEPTYENSGEIDIWRFHFNLNTFDSGFLPLSASEMKTKLKSRESVWQAAGVKNVSSIESDMPIAKGGNHEPCGDINKAAIDYAFSKLSETTRERYLKYGQQLIVGPDIEAVCPGGPCWIWDPLKFKKNDTENTATIQSVYIFEDNKNSFPCGEGKSIPCPTGFHYCKLLSPAKAMEWMYLDGLKNKLSTRQMNFYNN